MERYRTQQHVQPESLTENPSLSDYVLDFDSHWQEEGLPQDWYNLRKKVGFSMDSQMHMLYSSASTALWAERTRRDLLGFCLEYLSDGLVYTIQYEKRQRPDGNFELYDSKYGKAMLNAVSTKERNGKVKSSLERIQSFFLSPNTPDGSVAVMPSPLGQTGLTTDDGRQISYPDSYWIVMVKDNDMVYGCTIKTDFSLRETRRAITKFIGRELTEDTPLEDYVEAVALVVPWDTPWRYDKSTSEAIIEVLKNARDKGKNSAFKGQSWESVLADIQRGEELYRFDEKTQNMLTAFTDYVALYPSSELGLRKAVAATILRLSKHFLVDTPNRNSINGTTDGFETGRDYQRMAAYVTFGKVLDEIEKIPGCAGGGENSTSMLVFSLVPRVGKVAVSGDDEEDEYGFGKYGECKVCDQKASLGPCDICKACDENLQRKKNFSLVA